MNSAFLVSNLNKTAPFFSVCIPQYNRTSFLIRQCEILKKQTFKDFEICISDGGSTDGRIMDLQNYLLTSEMSFVLKKSEANLKYDENLRSSISMARGQYCFLMGNDDSLVNEKTLEELHSKLKHFNFPEAIVTNFEDWKTGKVTKRVFKDQIAGNGPWIAVNKFRNLSFISGLIINRQKAVKYAADLWDGSEMYQMYLFAKVIGEGGSLLELADSYVRKDIQIDGEQVDSYVNQSWSTEISERMPLLLLGPLNFDSIREFLDLQQQKKAAEKIFLQLYCFTYGFWIFEFRRLRSWKYAAAFADACSPRKITHGVPLTFIGRVKIYAAYAGLISLGLFVPEFIFFKFQKLFHRISKKG